MTHPDRNGWSRCPAGELHELDKRLRSQWLGRVYATALAGLLTAAAVAGAAWQLAPLLFPPSAPAGSPCTPCTPCQPQPPPDGDASPATTP